MPTTDSHVGHDHIAVGSPTQDGSFLGELDLLEDVIVKLDGDIGHEQLL